MRKLLPIMREQPGLVYLKLARRLEADGGEEVVLFEEWRDPDSVYAWAGSKNWFCLDDITFSTY